MTGKSKVFIGIGSNLGDRLLHMRDAVRNLQREVDPALIISPVYETTPVGFLEQPDFLNAVIGLETKLHPLELLARLQRYEAHAGRVRSMPNGPRTLDLDILLYDNLYICNRLLQIPHPRMWERAFVLRPLADLEPNRRGLGGLSLRELAERISQEGAVRYVGTFWEASARVP